MDVHHALEYKYVPHQKGPKTEQIWTVLSSRLEVFATVIGLEIWQLSYWGRGMGQSVLSVFKPLANGKKNKELLSIFYLQVSMVYCKLFWISLSLIW